MALRFKSRRDGTSTSIRNFAKKSSRFGTLPVNAGNLTEETWTENAVDLFSIKKQHRTRLRFAVKVILNDHEEGFLAFDYQRIVLPGYKADVRGATGHRKKHFLGQSLGCFFIESLWAREVNPPDCRFTSRTMGEEAEGCRSCWRIPSLPVEYRLPAPAHEKYEPSHFNAVQLVLRDLRR